jgi:hypothetical protein
LDKESSGFALLASVQLGGLFHTDGEKKWQLTTKIEKQERVARGSKEYTVVRTTTKSRKERGNCVSVLLAPIRPSSESEKTSSETLGSSLILRAQCIGLTTNSDSSYSLTVFALFSVRDGAPVRTVHANELVPSRTARTESTTP